MPNESTTRLDRADSGLQTSFSPVRRVNVPCVECEQAKLEKRYWHFGLRLGVRQYGIGTRKLTLALPAASNSSMKGKDCLGLFHGMKGSAFSLTSSSDNFRKLDKLYPVGGTLDSPGRFEADLTCATLLVGEQYPPNEDPDVYQLGGPAADLNKRLGQALAVNLSRTLTFRVKDTGNFDVADLERVNPAAPTEKMAMKLFVYLQAKVGKKQPRYFQVVDGVLGKEIGEGDMRAKFRCLDSEEHSDSEGGAMPYIPGVYQMHALVRSSTLGIFALTELHCDGDQIFP